MIKKGFIYNEEGVHGERWRTLHDSYFSDPEVASPFLDAIEKIINISHSAAVADLGGGTGFILSELLRRQTLPGLRLIIMSIFPKSSSPHAMISKLLLFRRQHLKLHAISFRLKIQAF